MSKPIIFEKVSQNNLKNISISIPDRKITTITGPSGSGKTSLAFDTIYAEGRRRFWTSVSSRARFFSEKFAKPKFETAQNLRPVVALEQRNKIRSSRDIVATITDAYDLITQFFALYASRTCSCGGEVVCVNLSSILQTIYETSLGRKITIMFPCPSEMNSAFLIKKGFLRAYFEGHIVRLSEINKGKPKYIVVDRIAIEEKNRARVREGMEIAFLEGDGEICLLENNNKEIFFKEGFSCRKCGKIFEKAHPHEFSFNSPQGACPECKGFGNNINYDMLLIIPDLSKSLAQGAVSPFEKPAYLKWKERLLLYCEEQKIETTTPYKDLAKEGRKTIEKKIRSYFSRIEKKIYKIQIKVFVSRYKSEFTCETCKGSRLKEEALQYIIEGKNIFQLLDGTIEENHSFFLKLQKTLANDEILSRILNLLKNKIDLGLSYLSLLRAAKTLSGGELQRVRLAGNLSSGLTGTLYILDEPTIGLHGKNIQKLMEILKQYKEAGNTVLIVEQDLDVINESDYILALGPGSGAKGGELVYSDIPKKYLLQLKHSLKNEKIFSFNKEELEEKTQENLDFKGVKARNLDSIDISIPLNQIVCLTGASGSGKSTFVEEIVYPALLRILKKEYIKIGAFKTVQGFKALKDVVYIDQSIPQKSTRSMVATYLKFFDLIRGIFASSETARSLALTPGHFSLNIPGGRCEKCNGIGQISVDMSFLGEIQVVCDECGGKRYKNSVLSVKCFGKTIDEFLQLSIDDLFQLDLPKKLFARLEKAVNFGLSYIPIGLSLEHLSLGEIQRLRILRELEEKKEPTLYIFDEPSLGLGPFEILKLISLFKELTKKGHSVLCVEHDPVVILNSNHVIELGPGGGEKGGRLIFSGKSEQLLRLNTPTGEYLRECVKI